MKIVRYHMFKSMRVLNPRGVWRTRSAADTARWSRLTPALRIRLRKQMIKAKRTPGTIAYLMEMAVLPPRPKKFKP